ncbi:MAG: type IV pilus secretin PilQ [candidate division NC10 bacterium]|nr:type IV pilus secretin PilQ [candidate division NC10 bacterium]
MMSRIGRVASLVLFVLAWAVEPAMGQPPVAPGRPRADEPGVAVPGKVSGPVKVTEVEVEPLGPTSATLVVASEGPLAYPESFSLPDPPRVVIDIPNAVHAIRTPIQLAKGGPVVQVRSSQYREQPVGIVRLVVDLSTPLPYRLEVVGGRVKVLIGEAAGQVEEIPALAKAPAGEAPRPTQILEEQPEEVKPPAPGEGQVAKIDFQPLKDRSRVVISTRGKVSYKVSEIADPPRVVVDISGASIAPEARRSLDVRQLPGVVNRIRSAQRPKGMVRVVAELKQRSSYQVAQTPEAITLDLQGQEVAALEAPPKPALGAPSEALEMAEIPAPIPPPGPPAAIAPPGPGRLSLDFKDADIGNILRILSEVGGVNIVAAGEEVKGKVTLRLINVDWKQALEVILKVNKLDSTERDNIILVASEATIQRERAAKEEAELRARRKVVEQVQLEPLVSKILPVNYSKAEDLQKHLDRLKTPARTDVSIVVDSRTNSLIINDVPAAIERMESLLKDLDKPTPQVLIEARLVEATRTFSQSLGITWGGASRAARLGSTTTGTIFGTGFETPVPGGPINATPLLPISNTGPVPLFVNFPAVGTAPAALGFVFGQGNRFVLGAQLSAAENEGTVKTLSAPKVATLDNQEAEIKQGTQVPFTTIDASGRTVVSFIDAFIRLKVTPHITADRRVSMRVEAERSFPGARIEFVGGFAFPINTRKATTNVLVTNGGTIVIAGLLQTTESEAEDRVPFLWRVPVLGYLFKRHSIGPNERVELLIFITPTILEETKLL